MSDAWAVGYNPQLAEHWDGTTWTSAPLPGSPGGALFAVDARATADVWSVGAYFPTPSVENTLIDHWDGASWTTMSSPNVTDNEYLGGVSADASNDVWAVGTWYDASYNSGTLIEHFC